MTPARAVPYGRAFLSARVPAARHANAKSRLPEVVCQRQQIATNHCDLSFLESLRNASASLRHPE